MWLRGKIVDNETKEGKMLIAEELKRNRDKRIVEEHRKRMYNMRGFSLEWQEIHQKRWGENSLCWDDECDCEALYKEHKDV